LVLPGFEPNPGNACNRRDVTDEIEVEFVVERRIARVGGSDYEKGVAVRGRFATASAAILLPAPARFSMTNG
jgi:hypothetical protein